MAAEEPDVSDYWGLRNGLANWLMDRMDASWYSEDFFEELNKNGMGKFTDFRQFDRKSFDSKLKKVGWNRKEKNEFVTKFEQDFGFKRFPNIFDAPENTGSKNRNKSKGRKKQENNDNNSNGSGSTTRGSRRISRKRQRGSDTMMGEMNDNSNEGSKSKTKTKSSKSKSKTKPKKASKSKSKTKTKNKTKTKDKSKSKKKSKSSKRKSRNNDEMKSSSSEEDDNENEYSYEFELDVDVLCLYSDGKVYEARIRDRQCKRQEYGERIEEYLLHFKNWNSRWDKWVLGSEIFDKNEENLKEMKKLNGKNAKRLKTSS